jgi:hypothetical protein
MIALFRDSVCSRARRSSMVRRPSARTRTRRSGWTGLVGRGPGPIPDSVIIVIMGNGDAGAASPEAVRGAIWRPTGSLLSPPPDRGATALKGVAKVSQASFRVRYRRLRQAEPQVVLSARTQDGSGSRQTTQTLELMAVAGKWLMTRRPRRRSALRQDWAPGGRIVAWGTTRTWDGAERNTEGLGAGPSRDSHTRRSQHRPSWARRLRGGWRRLEPAPRRV